MWFDAQSQERMDAEFLLVSIDTKISMKQELAEKSQFFQRVLKMGNFGQNAEGGGGRTLCKILELGHFFGTLCKILL